MTRSGFDSVSRPEAETAGGLPFRVVSEEVRRMLTDKQLFDYQNKQEDFARWLLREGKNTTDKDGYSPETAKRTVNRVSLFQRWVWEQEDSYIAFPEQSHADEYTEQMAYSEYSQSTKHTTLHSIKRHFKWRHHEHGGDLWDPSRSFTVSNSQNPQDHLTLDERKRLRDAALQYGTIPAYKTVKCKEERRERLKPYVAEQTGVPIDDQPAERWRNDDISSWRYTTLVWVSLDAGLRPAEVESATTEWVDTENSLLRIPKEDSTKSFENWEVSLKRDTADALEQWLYERSHYPKYDDTTALWLTNHGNPYCGRALGRLLRRLCDKADISYENRQMSWYSIRHSVGTYMTREEDLAAAQAQLRHKRPETTMKYDSAPPEDRRDALDRMG